MYLRIVPHQVALVLKASYFGGQCAGDHCMHAVVNPHPISDSVCNAGKTLAKIIAHFTIPHACQ